MIEFFIEKIFPPFLGLMIMALIGCLIFLIFDKTDENRMKECMKDHKEYECAAMLKSCHRTAVYPLIIPVR